MRRNLLVLLTFAILLPYIGGFFIAWLAFYQFERTMENAAASYARGLAHSAAARLESSQWDIYYGGSWGSKQTRSRVIGINEALLSGINVPGIFAVFDRSGTMLFGTDEQHVLSFALVNAEKADKEHKISGSDGRIYTVAVHHILERDFAIVAAVAWSDLLGPMVSLSMP